MSKPKSNTPTNYKVANGEQNTVQEPKTPRYGFYKGIYTNLNDTFNENS